MAKTPVNFECDVDPAQADPLYVQTRNGGAPKQREAIADLLAMPGIEDIELEINRSKELARPANLLD